MPFKQIPPFYSVWMSMKDRCRNPNAKAYPDYGGRGIKVCDRWMGSYAAFASDMGERPLGTSIERIDNEGDYTPSNCRWATKTEQQRNRRGAVYVDISGVRYRAIELAELAGVKTDTILERAKRGLSYDQVIYSGRHAPDYTSFIPLVVQKANATKAARTHCRSGHELTPANLHISKQGWRRCRECHNAKMRRLNAAKRAAT
jgi:hypothetical protein